MKKYVFLLTMLFFENLIFSQEVKPLYQLPAAANISNTEIESGTDIFLVGSDEGLFKVTNRNSAIPLWTEGRVDQIFQLNIPIIQKMQKIKHLGLFALQKEFLLQKICKILKNAILVCRF